MNLSSAEESISLNLMLCILLATVELNGFTYAIMNTTWANGYISSAVHNINVYLRLTSKFLMTPNLTFTVPHLATELTLVWTKNTDSLLKTVLFRDYITYIIAYNYILIYIIISFIILI